MAISKGEDLKESISRRLQLLLKERNLQQNQLAMDIGCSAAAVNNWINKKRLPNVVDLANICTTYGLSIDWMLDLGAESGVQRESVGKLKWQYLKPDHHDGLNKDAATGVELFNLALKKNMTISEIRRSYGEFRPFNESECGRLLRVAIFSRAVQILGIERDKKREAALQQEYFLEQCIVANLNELPFDEVINTTIHAEVIGFLAATDTEFIGSMVNRGSVGITGGTPIARFVNLVEPDLPQFRGIGWYSLLAAKRYVEAPSGTSANSLVARMVYKQSNSEGHLMPFLNTVRRTEAYFESLGKDKQTEQSEVREAFRIRNAAAHVPVALITVGSVRNFRRLHIRPSIGLPEMQNFLDRLSEQERARCYGDILLRPIDNIGQQIGDNMESEEYVYSITLEELENIAEYGQVWILAENPTKSAVIRAALTRKPRRFANSLLIDSFTADKLLSTSS